MSDDRHDFPTQTEAVNPPLRGVASEPTPEPIGPYRPIEKIGEGGMGSVWRAEQTAPLQRMVALKLIKPGMDSRWVIARFEAERQALALMEHPAIAKVFDAGTTPAGQPYFVMELVAGEPISEYCDRRRLGIRERLELFMRVCDGVQHAHQKAVLHRDLKPGNVLVGEVDGQPQPKIIDFGVAKATTQGNRAQSMFTAVGQVVGTPEYMSPEQADFTGNNVDTRTDVYSLGIILYELLTGALPFDPGVLRKAGITGIRDILKEQIPPRPSSRLSTLGNRTAAIAQVRCSDPRRLRQRLDGDLDWIVMRALEKDRDRRYGSPNELAQDIERHLRHEPVVAGPPSVRYRAGRFIRRHRTGVWVASAAVLALVAFSVTTSVQSRSIARERDRAEAEADKASAMNRFLREMLASADPWTGGDHDVTVAAALDAAVEKVGETFADQPLVEAEMRNSIAKTYLALGKLLPSEDQARRALEMRIARLGPDHPAVADSWSTIATLARGKTNYDEAIDAARELLRIRRIQHGGPHQDVIDAMLDVARNLNHARRFEEAHAMLESCEQMIHALGDAPINLAQVAFYRADAIYESRADAAAAEPVWGEALARFREHDPNDPHIPVTMNNLATMLLLQKRFDEARAMYEEALVDYRRRFGTQHPEYATTIENLANLAFMQQRYEDAFEALEQVREIRARNLGEGHLDVTRTTINMATVAGRMGRDDRALELFEELVPVLREVRGQHPDTATALHSMGQTLGRLGRHAESIATLREALAMYVEMYGENHIEVASTRASLGMTFARAGSVDEAETELVAALPRLRSEYGEDHRRTLEVKRILEELAVTTARGRRRTN